MDARLLREVVAKFGQSGVPDFLRGMKSSYFALKLTPQRLLGGDRELSLGEVDTQERDCRNQQHHGEQQLDAKAHGKFTLSVAPFVRLTGCSRVVLLVSHALSV